MNFRILWNLWKISLLLFCDNIKIIALVIWKIVSDIKNDEIFSAIISTEYFDSSNMDRMI